jgi:hypothetical protein
MSTFMSLLRWSLSGISIAVLVACSGVPAGDDPRSDGGSNGGGDAGVDAGFGAGVDAGVDLGLDAGFDGGIDAGFDGGEDAGSDADAGSYPGPPFGLAVGAVIPDFVLTGFPRPMSLGHTALQQIQLSDFYNPGGHDVFPAGSPYGAGIPKPRALILTSAAAWCAPANFEAQSELPSRRASCAPNCEILLVLEEGVVHGPPATESDLVSWVTRYNIDYPSSLDPNGAVNFADVVGLSAYPSSVLVRTRDMKIIGGTTNARDNSFWSLTNVVIDGGSPVLPGDP